MARTAWLTGAGVAALIASCGAARAQQAEELLEPVEQPLLQPETPPAEAAGRPMGPPKFFGKAEVFTGFSTDADLNGGGDFGFVRTKLRASINTELSARWRLEVSTSYANDDYDFGGSGGLAGLDPWDRVHTVTVRPSLFYAQDRKWTWVGGPIIQYGAEEGADANEALTFGGGFGLNYAEAPDKRFAIGIIVIDRLEDTPLPIPLLSFDWRVADGVWLRSPSNDLGPVGPGIEVGIKTSEKTELSLGISYGSDRFRLDDNGVAPGGIGSIDVIPLYARFDWDVSPTFTVAALAGVSLFSRVELADSNGVRISQEEADPAAAFGLRLTWNF